MAEQVYFSDRAVEITSARAVFGCKVFALRDIRAVRIEPKLPEISYAYRVALDLFFGALVMWATSWLLPLQGGERTSALLVFALHMGSVYLAAGGFLVAALWLTGSRYLLRVEGPFGRADVLLARHLWYALRVLWALRRARR